MELSNQFTNIDVSRKLKNMGVPQESLFVWEYLDQNCYGIKYIPFAVVPNFVNNYELFSAFSVSELLEFLPACIDTKFNEPFNNFWLHIIKRSSLNIQYICKYVCDTYSIEQVIKNKHTFSETLCAKAHDESLANCLAKTLISLIEQNLIKVGDLK